MDTTTRSYLYTLVKLMEDLELHAKSSADFFDMNFNGLVFKHLGYTDMSITVYDNLNYTGKVPFNRSSALTNFYDMEFYKRDSVARYITKNIRSLLASEDKAVIKGSDIMAPGTAPYIEYEDFLNRANLKHVAVLPFNENFRLAVYKDKSQSDFSDTELELLNCTLDIVRNKYNSFLRDKDAENAARIKNSILDSMGIGFFILDSTRNLLGYNASGAQYADLLFHKSHITSALPELLSMFSGSQPVPGQELSREKDGFRVTWSVYSEINYFGILRKYYYITLQPAHLACGGAENRLHKSSLPFDTLTARELEVLEHFCKGLDYKEMSGRLFISEGTVRTHLKNIYRKLDVDNQRRLVFEYSTYLAEKALIT